MFSEWEVEAAKYKAKVAEIAAAADTKARFKAGEAQLWDALTQGLQGIASSFNQTVDMEAVTVSWISPEKLSVSIQAGDHPRLILVHRLPGSVMWSMDNSGTADMAGIAVDDQKSEVVYIRQQALSAAVLADVIFRKLLDSLLTKSCK